MSQSENGGVRRKRIMAAQKICLTLEVDVIISNLLSKTCQQPLEDSLYSTKIRESVELVHNHSAVMITRLSYQCSISKSNIIIITCIVYKHPKYYRHARQHTIITSHWSSYGTQTQTSQHTRTSCLVISLCQNVATDPIIMSKCGHRSKYISSTRQVTITIISIFSIVIQSRSD